MVQHSDPVFLGLPITFNFVVREAISVSAIVCNHRVTGVKIRFISPWSEQKPQYLLTLIKQNFQVRHWGLLQGVLYLQHISIHSVPLLSIPLSNMGTRKTKALQWQHASWQLEKFLSVQIALPDGWEKMEEFTDWVFVAEIFSLPLPRFSWLNQSTNRRKGTHIPWPCHPKWLWHFQECSPHPALHF